MIIPFLRKITPKWALSSYHLALSLLSSVWYGNPSKDLIVIGVTGTNGKSTVTSFIGQLLMACGERVGWVGTATIRIGEKEWLNPTKMTTLGRTQAQKYIKDMVHDQCTYAIMETSSEGIAQHRHAGVNYDVAVFTNLTPEHLLAHGGFEGYKRAKLKLFHHLTRKPHKVLKGKRIPKIIVAAGAVEHASDFLKPTADKKAAWYIDQPGEHATIVATNIKTSLDGSEFEALGHTIKIKPPGDFNVENALTAMAVVKELGFSDDQIAKAAESLESIPGRMELIEEGQDYVAMVDYAHEAVGFQKFFDAIQEMDVKRVIQVFGSAGGGRDKTKRPVMGRISGTHADITIVTDEDSYDDDPLEIMEDIAVGAREAGKVDNKDLFIVPDRRDAIREAVKMAKAGDLVVISGKGCEQAIVSKNRQKRKWDDRVELRQAIRDISL